MSPRPAEGSRLGPYDLVARIGKGGMGEVWKAHDSRLGRDVAVKLSAETFSDRFEKEARAIAALNHPNICTLFDVGPNYLVMELIDGPTLADRIAQGPIPVEEAIALARQIADALDAAHEKNIVHRDLKPANIKVRSDGSVKVLDFGLAKSGGTEASMSDDSPTMMMATQMGVILGTAAYMAPEQARGKSVDKRADIWAFGVVLYEMVTGKQLFAGEDLTDTLASVVKSDPDLAPVPQKVRRLIAKCLEKDPKKRLRDIGDVWEFLDDSHASATALLPSRLGIVWPVVASVLGLALAALALIHFREKPAAQLRTELSVPLPEGSFLGFAAISPDGRRMVLSASTPQSPGQFSLYLRSLDSDDLRPLNGTADARAPIWSPDGRFIVFFADGRLRIIPSEGGPVQSSCEADGGGGIAWGSGGTILYSTEGRIWRTSAGGGGCTALNQAGATNATQPTFLPDGRHFFYLHRDRGGHGSGGVYLADLSAVKDGDLHGRRILNDISSVVYARGANGGDSRLLFLRESSLMAQSFDEKTLQTSGAPFPVANHASPSLNPTLVGASVSSNGILLYIADLITDHQLTWFDRSGRELGKVGGVHDQAGVALSPDGNLALNERRSVDGNEWWLYDLARNSERRIPSRGLSATPAWSPDSASVWMGIGPGSGLYRMDVGSGNLELMEKADSTGQIARPSDLSRDGRYLVFTKVDPNTLADIWYAPVEAGKPGTAEKVVAGRAVESQGQFSPDGKWLAYYSEESGTGQIYIRPFPAGSEVWRVSTGAIAREPRWRADGNELFFLDHGATLDWNLMSASVEPDGRGGLRVGAPQKLFEFRSLPVLPAYNLWSYSPHPDGKRFLVNAVANNASPSVRIVLSWQQASGQK